MSIDVKNVCSIMHSIVTEYVEMRRDLERVRDTVVSLQDLCDLQAASLRNLQNRLDNAQALLEIALRENEALIEESRVLK